MAQDRRILLSVPSDNCKEQRRDKNGNRGDPDPRGILCGLAQGVGGLPYGKGGMGGERCRRCKKPSIRTRWSFPLARTHDAFCEIFYRAKHLAPFLRSRSAFITTFEPGCRNSWHIHHHAKNGGGQDSRLRGRTRLLSGMGRTGTGAAPPAMG